MKRIAMLIGLAALGGTIVPPALVMAKAMSEPMMRTVMLISAIAWFTTAPIWMKAE